MSNFKHSLIDLSESALEVRRMADKAYIIARGAIESSDTDTRDNLLFETMLTCDELLKYIKHKIQIPLEQLTNKCK